MASIYEIAESETREEAKQVVREMFPEMAGGYCGLIDSLFDEYSIGKAAELGPREMIALFGKMRMSIISKEIQVIQLKATVEVLKRAMQQHTTVSGKADN